MAVTNHIQPTEPTAVHLPPKLSGSILAQIICRTSTIESECAIAARYSEPKYPSKHLEQLHQLMLPKEHRQEPLLLEDISTTFQSPAEQAATVNAATEVDCLKRGIEPPITFDQHVGRANSGNALWDVNKLELTSKMIVEREFLNWNTFEYRATIKIKSNNSDKIFCKTCITRTNVGCVMGKMFLLRLKVRSFTRAT